MAFNLFDFIKQEAEKKRKEVTEFTPRVDSPLYKILNTAAQVQPRLEAAPIGSLVKGDVRGAVKKLSEGPLGKMTAEDLALSFSPGGYTKAGQVARPIIKETAKKAIDRTNLSGLALNVPTTVLEKLRSNVPEIKFQAQKELEKYINPSLAKKAQTKVQQPAKDVFPSPRQKAQYPQRLLDQLEAVESKRLPRNSLTTSLEDRIGDSITDVKKKVNLLDYLRTPDRVLTKVGMDKEAKLLRQKYDDYLVELPKEIDRISGWVKRVPKDANQRIFKWLDGQVGNTALSDSELTVAKEIRSYLKEWAVKLKLPEDKQISDYITHLFPRDAIGKEFPEEIAKLIHGKVVKSVYDPFLQKRVNKPEYLEDTWEALSAYTKTATRKFHMDQALEQVAQKAESLPLESYNYVKGRISRINMQPMDIDNLLDNLVKASPIGYRYGQRPTAVVTRKARQAVFRGLLGLNPVSALRNIQQSTNTYAVVGERSFGYGLMKTIQNLPRYMSGADSELEKVGVLGKDILQDKTLSAVGKFWQKADDALFYMFNFAEKMNRSIAYFAGKDKAIRQGLSEQEAIDFAKGIVRKTQFNYDVIDTPAVLQSDLAKTIFQFGKYPLAQTEFLVEMVKDKNIAGSVRWLASNMLFIATAGKVLGLAPKDMFPQFRFDAPPTMQLPIETGKALLGVPDKYGKVPEGNPLERILQSKGVRRGLINYIPAGGQLKKTLEATSNVAQGGSMTPSGGLRYPAPSTNFGVLQSLLFGPSSTKEARRYYREDLRPLSEKQTVKYKQNPGAYEDILFRRKVDNFKDQIKEVQKDDSISEEERERKTQRLEREIDTLYKSIGL